MGRVGKRGKAVADDSRIVQQSHELWGSYLGDNINSKVIIGGVYGRLTTITRVADQRRSRYACKCQCGMLISVEGYALTSGRQSSCGCRCYSANTRKTTGCYYDHELYSTWNGMKTRCKNTKSKDYENYGGRGITVCSEWDNSFESFVKDMGERPYGHSIDRVNNEGNYEASNCRWATAKEQSQNRRKRSE